MGNDEDNVYKNITLLEELEEILRISENSGTIEELIREINKGE